MKPFIKWAGSKQKLLPQIEQYLPPTKIDTSRYYEPMLGSGSLFLHLEPKIAVIGDLNDRLMITWLALKRRPYMVAQACQGLQELYNHRTPEQREQMYYQIRDDFNCASRHSRPDVAIGTEFIFLNKAGFNGLYRENSQGVYNVPWGKRKRVTLIDQGQAVKVGSLLNGQVALFSGTYQKLLELHPPRPGDFIYFDPPYIAEVKSGFTDYSADGFSAADQKDLANVALDLAQRGVNVMISNSIHARDLYPGMVIHPISARRNIGATADRRGTVTELLFTSYKPAEGVSPWLTTYAQ